jgi:general secretion pathway protein M
MKDWFLALAPRERLLVSIGAALVVVMLVWGLLLAPLFGATSAAASRVETKRDLLGFLYSAAAELKAAPRASAARPDLADQSLVVIVDRSAREAGLGAALVRNQPVGEDGIRVRLENASFDVLAHWLAALNSGTGLAIESASFDRTPDDGHVNASLVFRQSLQ